MECSYYPCNCHCYSYTNNILCEINCEMEFTSFFLIRFKKESGEEYEIGENKKFFGKDIVKASEYLHKLKVNETFNCYYDPFFKKNDITMRNILIDNNFWDTKNSILFFIFGIIPLFCCLLIDTFFLIKKFIKNEKEVYLLTFTFWFGVIIPLIIVLPIAKLGLVNRKAWEIFFYVLLSIGNLPFIVYSLFLRKRSIKEDIPYALVID